MALLWQVAELPNNENQLVSRRSFYGVLHVTEDDVDTEDAHRSLYNGRILHGVQLTSPELCREPTTYYATDSGVGLAITTEAQWSRGHSRGDRGVGDGHDCILLRAG